MTDRKVMQQALDAFCKITHVMGRYDLPGYHNYLVVIANQQADALREAIAQPEQTAASIKPDTSKVICPACVHQFRAIPQDVQRLMLDAGFEPPFTQPAIAQPEQKANFCFRCGKLVSAIHDIHTCTPPVGHTN